jgi:hypothetical protein
MEKLLTRDEFREGVFKRDSHKCVIAERSVSNKMAGDSGKVLYL